VSFVIIYRNDVTVTCGTHMNHYTVEDIIKTLGTLKQERRTQN